MGNRITPDDHTLALDTFIKLMRSAESVSAAVHGDLKRVDLTVSQFGILEALYHLGPMMQKELADKILKSPGNITMVINNLEKRGLITRKRKSVDRRAFVIHPTDTGVQLIESIFPAHAETIAKTMASLTNEEQQTLGRLLKKLGRSAAPQSD